MTFERFEIGQFDQTRLAEPAFAMPQAADPRIQQAHAAIDALECLATPRSISDGQWYELLRDLRHVASNWLDIALACGWSLIDLFGSPPSLRGRVGLMGVAVLLKGREIESVDRETILIGNRLGAPNAFRRHSPAASEPFDMRGSALVWDVITKEQIR
ncbi:MULTISPECIES: hypothetical protein [unclassified Novosphingobium]|uniref:hypothetical protein n=1 Tax=unclassified Novosphingobium TaxID=2644732 RepID=UPI001357D7F1|nr:MULTISPECIES: hypothetical protein [unclassified Novosphingobium]